MVHEGLDSQNTFVPAFNALCARAKCVSAGVAVATAWAHGPALTTTSSNVNASQSYSAANSLAQTVSSSTMTAKRPIDARDRAMLFPQYPQPIHRDVRLHQAPSEPFVWLSAERTAKSSAKWRFSTLVFGWIGPARGP